MRKLTDFFTELKRLWAVKYPANDRPLKLYPLKFPLPRETMGIAYGEPG